MRVIIAGSRDITDFDAVVNAVADSGFIVDYVISGGARGVDRLGERYALDVLHKSPIMYKPKWKLPDGRTDYNAGKDRNTVMANNADALIAVWDGYSGGTADMINKAIERRLKVFIQLA